MKNFIIFGRKKYKKRFSFKEKREREREIERERERECVCVCERERKQTKQFCAVQQAFISTFCKLKNKIINKTNHNLPYPLRRRRQHQHLTVLICCNVVDSSVMMVNAFFFFFKLLCTQKEKKIHHMFFFFFVCVCVWCVCVCVSVCRWSLSHETTSVWLKNFSVVVSLSLSPAWTPYTTWTLFSHKLQTRAHTQLQTQHPSSDTHSQSTRYNTVQTEHQQLQTHTEFVRTPQSFCRRKYRLYIIIIYKFIY